MFVSRLRTVMPAPGTIAWLASVTVPEMVARSPWANKTPDARTREHASALSVDMGTSAGLNSDVSSAHSLYPSRPVEKAIRGHLYPRNHWCVLPGRISRHVRPGRTRSFDHS